MGLACVFWTVVFSGRLQPLGALLVRSQRGQSSRRAEKFAMPRPHRAGAAHSFLATTANISLLLATFSMGETTATPPTTGGGQMALRVGGPRTQAPGRAHRLVTS